MLKVKRKYSVLIAVTLFFSALQWVCLYSTRPSRSEFKTTDINYTILNTRIMRTPSYDNESSSPWDAQVEESGAERTDPGIDVAMHSNQSCPWDGISPPLDEKTRTQNEIHDLLRVKKPAFLPNYKNPCWFGEDQRTLLCLPYFHLAGFHKCGTTGTFNTIVGHPDVAAPKSKETHWIAWGRFKENSDIVNFAARFSKPAREIERRVLRSPTGQTFNPVITGDGSPSTVCQNARWRYFPGNYNCSEPRVLNPHYLYHHNPAAKIIILIRNPTDRMISAFNYMTTEYPVVTAQSFHEEMVKQIRTLEECFSVSSLRMCTYDNIIPVQTGLYHVFIRDWMKVFPPEQLLIARLEDLRDDPYRSYSEIFDFLDLHPVSRSQLKEMQKINRNTGKKRFTTRNETRRLLDNFYRPHNIELAKLLQNRNKSTRPPTSAWVEKQASGGDGSPATVCHNERWRYFPGNYSCSEPSVHIVCTITTVQLNHHIDKKPNRQDDICIKVYDKGISSCIQRIHEDAERAKEIRRLEECFSVFSVRTYIPPSGTNWLVSLVHQRLDEGFPSRTAIDCQIGRYL